MAHIDYLIERITDETLRGQIADEVAKILERTSFGIVFQRHSPEDIEVPGIAPRQGDKVRLRNDTSKREHVVVSARGGKAHVVPNDAPADNNSVAAPQPHQYEELVVVKDFSSHIFPGLAHVESVTQGGDKPAHVVIEAENFHALKTLKYTHERAIDAIYIDPPYNTGADDWSYNDRYVSQTDTYRHSKWLSFMDRRLRAAKTLLKPTGVIIVSIGDEEQHRLRMLMDKVFGAGNFISNVVWQGGRKNNSRYVSNGADYMLIYAKNEAALAEEDTRWREPKTGLRTVLEAARRIWLEADEDHAVATVAWRKWLRGFKAEGSASDAVTRFNSLDSHGRPIRTDGDLRSPAPRKNLQYDILHPSTGLPVRMHPNGWAYSRARMDEFIAEGRVHFGPDETSGIGRIAYLDESGDQVAESVFERDRNPSGKRLTSILGEKRFPYPKDHEVLMRWLDLVAPRDAVILDFFGGSGSTTEAVMRLNTRDGGTRQSILVTNNEVSSTVAAHLRSEGHLPGDATWEAQGVFERVTKPRIESAVRGKRLDGTTFDSPLEENVDFFRLTYEDENRVELGQRFDAIAPLLWLKAGGRGPIVRRDGDAAFAAPADATYGVLFDTAKAREFAAVLAAREEPPAHKFIVAKSESEFQAAVDYLPPEQRFATTRLYADYLHSFKINQSDE